MVLVDAIDEGRIVRVSEEYARREGLLILRKPKEVVTIEKEDVRISKYAGMTKKEALRGEALRKPLKKNENNILASLKDNFHWEILKARKKFGLSRKQLADKAGIKEDELKFIENGVIPSNDFVAVSKIEQALGVSLRANTEVLE